MEGGVSPVVTLVDVDGASPGAGADPGSLPGPGQGRGCPACLRYSGHCLHTMYGWLTSEDSLSTSDSSSRSSELPSSSEKDLLTLGCSMS